MHARIIRTVLKYVNAILFVGRKMTKRFLVPEVAVRSRSASEHQAIQEVPLVYTNRLKAIA